VLVCAAYAQDPERSTRGKVGYNTARAVCPQSQRLPRCRHIDENACVKDDLKLFAALRQIRSIRRSVTIPVLQSLVLTRLDYGIVTLAGLPDRQLYRLQSAVRAKRCRSSGLFRPEI